eukprot:1191380-Prorocentrum_minimum.AAC.3
MALYRVSLALALLSTVTEVAPCRVRTTEPAFMKEAEPVKTLMTTMSFEAFEVRAEQTDC